MTRRDLLKNAAATCAAARLWPGAPLFGESRPEAAWLKDIYRELHVDAHFGQLPAPYEGFEADKAAQTLKDAGFQMVSYFAICNAGYCYFPTKVGVTHPGLKRDFTGEMTAALKKRGIRVLAYVAVGPDRRFHKEHPEWMAVRAASQPAQARGDMAQMCTNSPWVEQAHIPQLKEIVSLYDVDGFFLDSLINKFVRGACYCQYCQQAFRAETGGEIPAADGDPNVFAHYHWLSQSGARYADKVIVDLTAAKPGLAFVLNHIWVTRNPVKPPASVTQLVWEPAPPYPGTLSLDFSLEARYLSSQSGIANWSCMTTRGDGWGDFSLRDPAAFRHEAAVLLASGGRPYFGDDSYPSGNPDPAVYKVLGEVNRRTAELEPMVRGSVPVKETAVLLSADSMWATLPFNPPREWMGGPSSAGVAGAHKALVEEHAQFGILNSEGLVESLADYKVLVLPEQCILGPRECDAIRRFVLAGGTLIATGDTGTRDVRNQPLEEFSLAEVLGVRYSGRAEARRAYLRVRGSLEEFGIPAMDVQVAGGYSRMQAVGAKTLLELVPPAGPKQAPSEAAAGPGVTINQFGEGKAIYCAVGLFAAYYQEGTPVLRKLAAWMLHLAHPPAQRVVVLENTPLNVEVTYNARGSDRFVHLLNYTGDKRIAGAQRLQDFSAVQGIRVGVRCNARPRRVLLAAEKKPIAFEWKDGRAWFQARPLILHDVYMMEN
jgi:putative glycosyl hydrolase-like family 6 (GHL6) protein/glycosyl hydrolase family 42 (putative beta-galactosidase)